VWQNLWVAQNSPADHVQRGFLARWLGGSRRVRAEIGELLEFSGLAHRQDELASNLAFGDQRRLELARALAARPKLLCLDEPAAGMNAEEIEQLAGRIRAVRDRGHHRAPHRAPHGARDGRHRRIAVLNFGQKIAEGTPAEVQADAAVRKAYLGGGDE